LVSEDRLAALRLRFDSAVLDLRGLLLDLRGDDWARVCSGDGWPVALEGLHVALGYRRQGGFLDDAFVRGTPNRFSWDETNDLNAQIARRRRPDPRFVLRFLEEEAGRMHDRLAAFAPSDLARPTIDYEGRVLTLDQFIRGFVIGHTEGHTASIRGALA